MTAQFEWILSNQKVAMPQRPRLWQIERPEKQWRRDHPDVVIVGKGSQWANPFKPGDPIYPGATQKVITADHAVDRFACWLSNWRINNPAAVKEWLTPLRGRELACWCRLDWPCHRNILLTDANAPQMIWDGPADPSIPSEPDTRTGYERAVDEWLGRP